MCELPFKLGQTCFHIVELVFSSAPNGIREMLVVCHNAGKLVRTVRTRETGFVHAFVQVLALEPNVDMFVASCGLVLLFDWHGSTVELPKERNVRKSKKN